MQDTESELRFIEQLPGLVCLVDYDQRLLGCNEYSAKILGFKNISEALGVTLYDVPCKVSEYAKVFESQNRGVVTTQNAQKILDVHPFAHDEMKAFLVNKTPFRSNAHNQNLCLVIGTEIKKSTLLQISLNLVEKDKKRFQTKGAEKHLSYRIVRNLEEVKLSTRELECLFHLVRGKTSADIAELTKLSKRTIESYIDNIKIKMNCISKADLIEKAIENNFIDFVPEGLMNGAMNHLSLQII